MPLGLNQPLLLDGGQPLPVDEKVKSYCGFIEWDCWNVETNAHTTCA
jgi:hypothetical protein